MAVKYVISLMFALCVYLYEMKSALYGMVSVNLGILHTEK